MSFAIVILKAEIEREHAATKSINKMLFTKFLIDIWTQTKIWKREKNCALFCVNYKVYCNCDSKNFMKK